MGWMLGGVEGGEIAVRMQCMRDFLQLYFFLSYNK